MRLPLLLLAVFVANTCQARESTGFITVRGIRGGPAWVVPANGTERRANVGMMLREGVVVRTDRRSVTDLFLGVNGAVVRLTPGTRIEVQKLRYESKGEALLSAVTVLHVQKGRILANFRKVAEATSYEVKTRRGTIRRNQAAIEVRENDELIITSGPLIGPLGPSLAKIQLAALAVNGPSVYRSGGSFHGNDLVNENGDLSLRAFNSTLHESR